MKNKIITLSSILIFVLASCNNNKGDGNCTGIVVDVSDTFIETKQLDGQVLPGLFKLKNDPNASAVCLVSSISDKRYTEILPANIESESTLEANSIDRKHRCDSFYHSVERNIKKIKRSGTGTEGSFVCHSIAQMLNRISLCSKEERQVFVLSDLEENSPIFSVYHPTDLHRMRTKPSEVFAFLDEEYPLNDLNGIELIFIHQPSTKAQDEMFHFLSKFFISYYSSHGAKVSVSTTLNDMYHGAFR